MKLFKFVGDHIYVRLKSMVRGSDIEACGPYHSLNTQFVQSPSQGAVLSAYPRRSMCTLDCSNIKEIQSFTDESPWFAAVILKPVGYIIH